MHNVLITYRLLADIRDFLYLFIIIGFQNEYPFCHNVLGQCCTAYIHLVEFKMILVFSALIVIYLEKPA